LVSAQGDLVKAEIKLGEAQIDEKPEKIKTAQMELKKHEKIVQKMWALLLDRPVSDVKAASKANEDFHNSTTLRAIDPTTVHITRTIGGKDEGVDIEKTWFDGPDPKNYKEAKAFLASARQDVERVNADFEKLKSQSTPKATDDKIA